VTVKVTVKVELTKYPKVGNGADIEKRRTGSAGDLVLDTVANSSWVGERRWGKSSQTLQMYTINL
jgi:hypothetical protein